MAGMRTNVSSDMFVFFFFNDTATTEIYTLSLHDALPICQSRASVLDSLACSIRGVSLCGQHCKQCQGPRDRKSTRLNSSHANISYAVFCLKKKKQIHYSRPSLYQILCCQCHNLLLFLPVA